MMSWADSERRVLVHAPELVQLDAADQEQVSERALPLAHVREHVRHLLQTRDHAVGQRHDLVQDDVLIRVPGSGSPLGSMPVPHMIDSTNISMTVQ